MAPKKGRSVQLAMEEATSEEVRRADSQEPLRDATSSGAGASPVDMAVIWVKKAAKGSTQWTDIGTKRQLSHYKFRKRLKPLTVLIKFLYLGLAFVEVPSWCLVKDYCLEKDGIYSWKILQLPFQVSNGIDIFCLLYLAHHFGNRHRSLGFASKTKCWHLARCFLVVLALVDCAVAIFNRVGIVPGAFRVCRVCRPLILMCATKFLRRTLNRLWLAFVDFWTVLASLALCVIFFVWLGIVIFARTKDHEGENHFDEWSQSAASLWILFTTANFPDVMVDSYTNVRMSFFFFFFYLVISLYLLNNILLAAVYDAYKDQLRNQLQTFYRKQSYSIDRAFQLLADHSAPPGLNTRHARAGPNELAERDPELVHVLSDPQIYIPLRPLPEASSTTWGRRLRFLFQKGIAWRHRRLPWWMVVDFVVFLEIALAFGQTCIFVSPVGGKFNDQPLAPRSIWFRLLSLTTGFVFVNMILQIVTFGLDRFWNRRRLRHRFDLLSISALCGLEIASCCFSSPPDYLLRTLLVLHISRGICLTEHVPPLRYLAAMVAHLVPVYSQLGLLLFLVYYIFATVGVQLFGGLIDVHNPNLDHTGFAEAQYWPLNFNDFLSALVTLFCLMVVNNWYVVADGFMAVTSNYSAIFFVCFFVSVNLVVLNILMTLILESLLDVKRWETGTQEAEPLPK
ncbi:Two pore calcium channel protein 1 (Calcium channel protein 1) (AtCCH1) (Fatty acid oxygenation up-regulated protein 2) (Voltage-dependent calcium channel protein TPC1) (AtTPC1) [Durusdinium trenchii]|uniref:Two pore calcium channel protein 1 (Calcium channel protein 1) (AtCCH1) (Fatty acid oxygenation up-regulated protein 2) (Voltage-dependent calcium channel protein TPC1) (AtTPC1) n=1 Tax=Durusdinium trenchii TaxID=1381693 RepID=A0ABP0R0Y4_9DINO